MQSQTTNSLFIYYSKRYPSWHLLDAVFFHNTYFGPKCFGPFPSRFVGLLLKFYSAVSNRNSLFDDMLQRHDWVSRKLQIISLRSIHWDPSLWAALKFDQQRTHPTIVLQDVACDESKGEQGRARESKREEIEENKIDTRTWALASEYAKLAADLTYVETRETRSDVIKKNGS